MPDTILGSILTTSSLTVNGPAVQSTVDTSGDQDWWRVNLVAGTTYIFRLDKATGSTVDPYLRLLNSAGTQITYNDDYNGSFNSQITYTATTTGAYYLSAQAFSISTGNYVLAALTQPTLSIVATSAVKAEGNSGTTAYTFTVNRSNGVGTSTVNWAVQHGTTVAADFSGTTSGSLTFAEGETSKVITLYAVGDVVVEGNETFSVALSGATGATLATTTAQGTITNDDVDSILGTAATTSALTVNGAAGQSAINFSGDQDWWRVNLVAGTTYTFRMDATAGSSLDSYLRLLNSAGTQITYSDDSNGTFNSLITYTATTSGVHYLSAQSFTSTIASRLSGGYQISATAPTISIAPTSASKAEGNSGTTAFTFTVTRASGTGTASVAWSVAHGTTTAADFSGALSGSVSFAAGETSKVITVNVAADVVIEGSETFSVVLSAPVGGSLGTASATGTILNDDADTILATTASTTALTVGGTAGQSGINSVGDQDWWRVNLVAGTSYTFNLSAATGSSLNSYLRLLNAAGVQLAVNDNFGTGTNSQISYTATTTGTYYLSAQGSGTSTGLYQVSATSGAPVTPALAIVATSANKAEGNGSTTGATASSPFTFTVTRSSGVGTSSVNWAVQHGTTSAADFSGALSGTVTFAAGETSKVITLNVVDDRLFENSETFDVVLSGAVGATLPATPRATGTIVNDDTDTVLDTTATTSALTVNGITLGSTVDYAGDQDWWRVNLVAGTTYTFTMNAASGSTLDTYLRLLNATGTQLAFNDDVAAGVFNSQIVYTATTTGTHYLSAQGFNGVSTGAYSIGATSPQPSIGIAATSADKVEGQSGTTGFTFTVTRNTGVGTASVNWALQHGTTTAADFTGATSGTVTFAAGETSKVITLGVVGDTAIESDETFSVVLSGAVGAGLTTATAAGRILNDDYSGATLSIAATSAIGAEGQSGSRPYTFTVTRSNGSGTASVNWGVTHVTTTAADFTGATSGTITFAVGETSKVITVNVLGDTTAEGDETFSVGLSGATGATVMTTAASATGVIYNDDGSRPGIDRTAAQVTSIVVPATTSDSIDNLVGDTKWGGAIGSGTTLTYSFTSTSSVFLSSTYNPLGNLNDTQRNAARMAMASISRVCGITFVEVADTTTSAGDIRWSQSLNGTEVGTAEAYYPSTSPVGGDIWLGPNSSAYTNPVVGGYGYHTFIHELGHALGLEHPHDGSPAPVAGEDQAKYSVMSYKDFAGDSNNGYGAASYATTYMLNDVAALQYLYGVNENSNEGDTVYSWSPTQVVFECLWDTGGNDTISASNQTQACQINLNGGQWSTIGAGYNNSQSFVRNTLVIANEVTGIAGLETAIENAVGSAYADTLTGNAYANTLTGGAGADTLTGGAGADVFRFVTATEGGDTITDFTSGSDRIQVVSSNFGALPVGTLATTRFVSGTSPVAGSTSAVFLYNTTTGQLTWDSNGSTAGGTTVLANLGANRTLVAGDIQVVAA